MAPGAGQRLIRFGSRGDIAGCGRVKCDACRRLPRASRHGGTVAFGKIVSVDGPGWLITNHGPADPLTAGRRLQGSCDPSSRLSSCRSKRSAVNSPLDERAIQSAEADRRRPSNSSQPPSSEALGLKAPERRLGSNCKRGSLPGPPDAEPELLPIARVDEVVEHHSVACRRCAIGRSRSPLSRRG
jgi:hypothetical protein